MLPIVDPMQTTFAERGLVTVPDAVPLAHLQAVLDDVLALCQAEAGRTWPSAHDPELARWLAAHPEAQARVYRAIRTRPSVHALARGEGLRAAVGALLGTTFGVYDKVPVRIDTPLETRELAVWHQDHHYVRGNTAVVTAWVPLQDTSYVEGCLQVMPGSHRRGPVPHPTEVLGKRHVPDGLADHDIRLVPVQAGDVVLFHACLLHSGSLNLSPSTRFSVQARYTPLDRPSDPAMGTVHPLERP